MARGSLVVVGSGIMSVGQITLEARGWIEASDLVVYCVADPATEDWIKRHSQDSRDLYTLYGNDRARIRTYEAMVDAMVGPVRAGKRVCAVFYGHPGVFVHPSHAAIAALRADGYEARMLPGVSALDTLFADLGVDPSVVGCVTFEATDMLIRGRELLPESHVIVWQIGCVGDMGFNFGGYDNRNLRTLVEYLERFYSADHVVTHYQGAQYPVCPPLIERLPLGELVSAQVTGISTLYVPPVAPRPVDRDMVVRLGLVKPATNGATTSATTTATASTPTSAPRRGAYYMPTIDGSALARYIELLATDPRVMAAHRADPERAARLYAQLSDTEREAIVSRHGGRIRLAMKDRAPIASILHAVFDGDDDDPDVEALRTVSAAPAS